jgi:cytochrome oxidase Cu insertion factor (SCO1/SenC/PrrC family)
MIRRSVSPLRPKPSVKQNQAANGASPAKSRAELGSILVAYGQTVDKRLNSADPQGPLYHILRVFLIDREGRVRNIYSSGTLDPRLVLADVKTLLLENL